ncbi:MAG TPA: transposase [Epsilonproteobacteria bacterium]|nr:transposase [Campylobacterota bacterium]
MLKLLRSSSKNNQPNLFHSQLRDMLDSADPLIALADTIEWDYFAKSFAKYYSNEGRPAKPIRLMVGLLLLKQIENLSDESVVLQWKQKRQ